MLVRYYNSNVRTSNVIIIAIYLMGKMIDVIFEGIYFTKLLIIISDKNEQISEEIGEKIRKGATRIIWKRNVYKTRKISTNVCCSKRRC